MSAARATPLVAQKQRPWTVHSRLARPQASALLLLVADMVCLTAVATVSIATWARFGLEFEAENYVRLWPLLPLFPIAYFVSGLYRPFGRTPADELRRLCATNSIVYAALAVTVFLLKDAESYSRATFLLAWGQTILFVPLFRALVRTLFSSRSWWGYPVAVAGPAAARIAEMLEAHPRLGLRPLAVVPDTGAALVSARGAGARRVILTVAGMPHAQALASFNRCSELFSEVIVIPDLSGFASLWVEACDLHGVLGLEIRQRLLMRTSRMIKRAVDVGVVIAASVLLLPLAALLAALIKVNSRGPVFYGQVRYGAGGRPFKAWKFRSMVANADDALAACLRDPVLREEWKRTHKLRHDPRITAVGRFLRRTSLDELPQFWNILMGEMSLVGPRPIVAEEIPRYGEAFTFYQKVVPGLTGLWQVSGRNRVSYEDRVALDTYYIRNWSPWLDLYILARTVPAVLFTRGAY